MDGERMLKEAIHLMQSARLSEAEDLIYNAALCAYFANADELRFSCYVGLRAVAQRIGDTKQALELIQWAEALALRKGLTDITSTPSGEGHI